jgi:GPI mannosyltransferase 3
LRQAKNPEEGGPLRPAFLQSPLLPRRVSEELVAGAFVFLVAFGVRLLPVFAFPGINHQDEIFQSIEQAHRLVYGTGLVPWEFVYGTRSWVFPGVLAGLMYLASLFGDGPGFYIPVIGCAMAALGAGAVLCAFLWGKRLLGISGGIIAGFFTAVWIDNVYFGPRTLSGVVAAHLLVIGLYAGVPANPSTATWRRAAAAGSLLILAGSIRVQLMPAIVLVGLWILFTGLREHKLVFIGSGVLAGLLYGGVDAFTWGYPFESLWRNIIANLYYNIQGAFGERVWDWYPAIMADYWIGLAPLVLLTCLIGAWKLPQPLVMAAIIGLSYTIVPHKEFRFIYPAILLATIDSGLGLACIALWVSEGLVSGGLNRRRAVFSTSVITLAIICLAQLALAHNSPKYQALWARGGDPARMDRYVEELGSVCGIGLRLSTHEDWDWGLTGGYALLHRAVPLYWATRTMPLDRYAPAFNTLIYRRGEALAQGYATLKCFGGQCVAQRHGSCSPLPMPNLPPPKHPLGDWRAVGPSR